MRVELNEIKKYFGNVKANDGISISFEPGRVYGLLGENGAGKSTLMKVLSGFQQSTSGQIIVDGKVVSFNSPAQALSSGIGMIYQDPLVVPSMSVIENFHLGRDSKIILDNSAASRQIKQQATKLGFHVNPKSYIDMLSLGERQQLELLRLLVLGAEVLILDEPTTGISAEQKGELFRSLRQIVEEERKTVIFVSHKMAEVMELCDHVYVLKAGKFVGDSTVPCKTKKLVRLMFDEIPMKVTHRPIDTDEIALDIQDLNIADDRLNMKNIQLKIKAGEVIGLAGLEGSGQRLFLKVCAGLVKPNSGAMYLFGKEVTQKNYQELRPMGVRYLPAGRLEEGLVAGLTIMEHVGLIAPGPSFFIDWKDVKTMSESLITHYQIMGKPATKVEALSGGNQQRTLFALLGESVKLLLLEHPTRGLDVRSTEWIWQTLFDRLSKGTAIIFISSDLDELIERSDRTIAFSGGVMSSIADASKTSSEELGFMIGGEL